MLDPSVESRVRAEATRRGIDPEAAVAEAKRIASTPEAEAVPSKPIADRMLVGFLPFIKVRELRAGWLGLDDRIPDDEMTCGDYQLKHGGGSTAPTTTDPTE
jgi:hypothetical protein